MGVYIRLVDFNSQQAKEDAFLQAAHNKMPEICYSVDLLKFFNIPGNPIAYWISKKLIGSFVNPLFYDYSISDGQNVTSDNARFVRYHWEIESSSIGHGMKWRLYAKGGGFRKWYGNLVDVVDWSSKAIAFYHKEPSARVLPEYLWYKKGITWGLITNSPSFRLLPEAATFDKGGSSIFLKDYKCYNYYLGLLNSKVFLAIVRILNPTLNFQVKDIRSMPIIISEESCVDNYVSDSIAYSKIDWDSFETSWDFKKHPLI